MALDTIIIDVSDDKVCPDKLCPECGLRLYKVSHEGTFAFPECVVFQCDCGYESDPE